MTRARLMLLALALVLILVVGAYLLGRWELGAGGALVLGAGLRRLDPGPASPPEPGPQPDKAGAREDRRLEVAREAAEGSSGVEDLARRHGLPVLSGPVTSAAEVRSLRELVDLVGEDIPAGPLAGGPARLDDEHIAEAMR